MSKIQIQLRQTKQTPNAVRYDAPGDVHDDVCAVAVGVHELVGADDRAVDVALGREVHDDVVPCHRLFDGRPVGDVTLHEAITGIVLDGAQIGEVAGIGQGVVHGDRVVGRGEDVLDVVGADEPGAAGDEQPHGQR